MNDSPNDQTRESGRRPQGGPPLALLAVILLVLLLGGLAVRYALGGMMPLPYGADFGDLQAYVRAEPVAVQVIAVAVFASSVPLAIYAATASARLRQLGVTAPGVTIALAGGILAAGALGLSGLVAWTLSRPEVSADESLVRALYYLVFLTGGPAHVVTLGLLVAGMAVPGLILGLLPSPLAVAGLVIAVLAELTTLVLVWTELGFLLPIAQAWRADLAGGRRSAAAAAPAEQARDKGGGANVKPPRKIARNSQWIHARRLSIGPLREFRTHQGAPRRGEDRRRFRSVC